MGKKTVRGHDIANRFVYSLSRGIIFLKDYVSAFYIRINLGESEDDAQH